MKRTSLTITAILALSASLLASLSAMAATTNTWNGGSATTNSWSDAANWINGVPLANAVIQFSGGTRLNVSYDVASSLNYGTTYFIAGAGPFIINQGGSAAFYLNGNLWNNSTVGTQTINVPMQVIFGNPGGMRNVSVTNGGSLVINGVMSQNSGSANGLFVTGSGSTFGALTLAAANTFSGPVTNNGATININNSQALGTGGPLTLNARSVINNTSGNNITTLDYGQNWMGNFTFTGATNLNLGAGAVTLGANVVITNVANTLTVGGSISGAFSLTKVGAGTLKLGGANAYTGDTTVSVGTLQMGAAGVMPSGAGKGNLSLAGTLDLNTFSQSINALSGAGTVDSVAGGTPTLTVGNNNQTSTFTGLIKNTAGSLGLTKTGSGTLTLNGTHTFSGATTVSGGKLAISTAGSCANSAVSVGASSTLGLQVASAGGQWTCAGLAYTDASAVQQCSFGFLTPSATIAPLQVNGDLSFTAAPTLQVLSGVFAAGSAYPLIHYTGNLLGTAPATATMPPHVTGSISNDASGKTIWLVVTSFAQPLNWAAGSAAWDINLTANWQDTTGAGTTYQEPNPPGDAVMFEDIVSGAGPITVTLNTNVSPASVTASNSAKAYTISGTGAIAGPGGLTKMGTNTLTLATTNSYTGATTLSGGSLSVGTLAPNGTNSPLGSGTSLVFNGGTLKYTGPASPGFNRAITINSGGGMIDERSASGYLFVGGVISGIGGGAFTNASTQLIVTNNNSYDGITYIIAGQTQIRHVNALGSTAGKTVVGSGAQLAAGGGLVGTINENLDLNGVGTTGALAAFDNNTAVTFAGTINLVTDSGIGGNDNFTISGPIIGNGGLFKLGTITNTLTGTNTYTGNTTISGGTLVLSGNGTINASPTITVGSGTTLDVSGVAGGSYSLAAGQTLQGYGLVKGLVVLPAGATVAPGGSIGTLTFATAPTLNGVTAMEINKTGTTLTNDILAVSSGGGTLNYGGTLNVVLLAGSDTPASGDSFILFRGDPAASTKFSGSFTVNPPALPGGLGWDTSQLAIDGTIRVVTVCTPPYVGAVSPAAPSVCAGSTVTFSVPAPAGTGPFHYQWRKNGGSVGTDSSSYTTPVLADGDNSSTYDCVVSGACAPNATAAAATLTVNPLPSTSAIVGPAAVCPTQTGVGYSVTSTAGSTYAWTVPSDASITTGQGSSFITVTFGTTAGTIAAIETSAAGCVGSQVSLLVSLNSSPVLTTDATNQTVCVGSEATWSVSASGTGVAYQWQRDRTNLVEGLGNFTGTTAPTLTNSAVALDDAAVETNGYLCVISGTCSPGTNSTMVALTVSASSVGGAVTPSAAHVCTGSGTTVGLTGQSGAIVGWESSVDNFTATTNEIAATDNPLDTGALTVTTYYRAVVQSGVCSSALSSAAQVIVDVASAGGTASPLSSPVCAGTGTTISLTGQTGDIVKWQSSADGGATWEDIASTDNPLTAAALAVTTQFRAVVQSGACAAANSAAAIVAVDAASAGGTTTPMDSSVIIGNGTSVSLSGQIGAVVKWQFSTDNGSTWSDIASTANTLATGPLLLSTQYRAVVQSGVCAAAESTAATVTVVPLSPPTLSSIQALADNTMQLTFSGPAGQTYKLIADTALTTPMEMWGTLATGTFGASPVTFTDIDATNHLTRFYRITSP